MTHILRFKKPFSDFEKGTIDLSIFNGDFLTLFTNAMKGEAVILDLKTPILFNDFLHIFQEIVDDFLHLSTFDTDKVVVNVFRSIFSEIISGNAITETDFYK